MKIEHNIPIPLTQRFVAWPFKAMQVNDSVFISEYTQERICATCHGYGAKTNKKFKTRAQIENGIKGVRVWRTK